ncbi:transmembrane protein 131 homolog [Penaeus monodon]|uniref:transmembrane protein 131 homolog n=1 Tax=Penaeus monodon TaxID=6687 RepID=UPI0018A7CE6A|nr:transmembrane protein 131 homolog [Penaeus monodon]
MASVYDVTNIPAVMEGATAVKISLKELDSSAVLGFSMEACRRIQESYNNNEEINDETENFGKADVSHYNKTCELVFKEGVMTLHLGPQKALAMPLGASSSALAVEVAPRRLVILGRASSSSFSLGEVEDQVALVLRFGSEGEAALVLERIGLGNTATTSRSDLRAGGVERIPTPPAKPPRMHQRLRAQQSLPAPRLKALSRQQSLQEGASHEGNEPKDAPATQTFFLSPSSAADANYPVRGTLSGHLHAQNCRSGIYDPVPEPKRVAESESSATPEPKRSATPEPKRSATPEPKRSGSSVSPVPHLLVSTTSPQQEVATSEPVLSPVIRGEAQVPPFPLVSSPRSPSSPAGRLDSRASPGEGAPEPKFDFKNV